MPVQNFHNADDVLVELLAVAEQRFGPRDTSWSIGAVEIDPNGPHLNPDAVEMVATVCVNEYVNNHLPNLYSQIAHEVIHLLNPGPQVVNYLEEGVACIFQDRIIVDKFGNDELQHQLNYRDTGYRDAKSLAERLRDFDNAAFIEIRRRVGAFHQATPSDLIELFTDLTVDEANQLCTQCRLRD